jgi:two-component system sensor histidine kinase PilS (NtrC family)
MAAGLAHEIRNPLGSDPGRGGIAGRRRSAGSRKRELFDVLRKESKRLGAVVDDFLNFARPRPLALAPVDIAVVVERAVPQMQIDASVRARSRSKCGLAPRLPARGGRRRAAPPGLFSTCCSNAIRRKLGARPNRSVSPRAVSRQFASRRGGHGSGLGRTALPPTRCPRVSTTRSSPRARAGTGLGLSISHTIVSEHGGLDRHRQRARTRLRVCVTLPVAKGKR